MPIHYVGKAVNWKGKKLFEILCNLKNFGAGRIVIQYSLQRYPEPCYYRVVKAEPKMDPENIEGTVWLENIFRGVNCGIETDNTVFKQDWQLIPKAEEEKFLKIPVKSKPDYKILPATKEFPPLFKLLLKQDRKLQGLSVDEVPQLPLQVVNKPFNRYRLAEPGEKPTEELSIHVCPELLIKSFEKI
uniref:28S ribosomal protein S34, mitochondrial n=1 Tax=Strigamia maritima TaxID=126957 RepID=T1J893_STRMM